MLPRRSDKYDKKPLTHPMANDSLPRSVQQGPSALTLLAGPVSEIGTRMKLLCAALNPTSAVAYVGKYVSLFSWLFLSRCLRQALVDETGAPSS